MDPLQNLNIHSKKVDLSLAKEYLKGLEINPVVAQHNQDKLTSVDFWTANVQTLSEGDYKFNFEKLEKPETLHLQVQELIKKIDQNALLFAQLECLLRKVPIEDVLDGHLSLIKNWLQYVGSEKDLSFLHKSKLEVETVVTSEAPLFLMGCVGLALRERYSPAFEVHDIRQAPVYHLFTKLCREVGIKAEVVFIREGTPQEEEVILKDINTGCVGVVTERCDLDSAVHTFLNTTTKSPWRLRRILVQESVYAEFKRAMQWKCSVDAGSYASGDKLFHFDFPTEATSTVLIEAYRTQKELLSLLEQYRPFFLSLWAAGRSEADEIAYRSSAPVVWIDCYGVFDGPPQAALPVYPEICRQLNIETYYVPAEFVEQTRAWAAASPEKRVQTLTEALEATQADSLIISSMKRVVAESKPVSFIEVKDGSVCAGFEHATGILYLQSQAACDFEDLKQVVTSLCLGYGYIVRMSPNKIHDAFIKIIARAGVPLLSETLQGSSSARFSVRVCRDVGVSLKWKVVWSKFGTIFAN